MNVRIIKSDVSVYVAYQVEVQAETLAAHDDWDATPLYYAAYSGNKELVKYLLSVGARCEEKVC